MAFNFLRLFLMVVVLLTTGCTKKADSQAFRAILLEAEESALLVRPLKDTEERRSSDRFRIPLPESEGGEGEWTVGSLLEIRYSGGIREMYPAEIDGVTEVIRLERERLTLAKLKEIVEKEKPLSWESFEEYEFEETGSGLYIRVYTLEEGWQLWIGGSGPFGEEDGDPIYMKLMQENKPEEAIDIRTDDLNIEMESK